MSRLFVRRFIVMFLGLFVMGLGVGLFNQSFMGTDPHTAFNLSISGKVGLSFSVTLAIVNCIWFLAEFTMGRIYIGIGTFTNWLCVGPMVSWWMEILDRILGTPENIMARIVYMISGVLILSLSVSLYQTPNLGIAPYDSIAFVLSERLPIPYFWCRIITDSFCSMAAFLLGGVIGLGTLMCALGLGPFITFFNKHISEKLVS